jgi:cyclopropane fatty-acyl-phospholipid synthase-like methyltransferase
MGNKNIEEYYLKMAEKITDPKATRNNAKDFTEFDVKLMKDFADKNKTLLDMGSGTGLLINNLIDSFKHITAIEKYPNFSKFITKSHKIKLITEDLLDLGDIGNNEFDVVSLLGVMNYFSIEEAKYLYDKSISYLKKGGALIVKNQFGINEDVIIDGYSEELKTDYYSEYRQVDKEIQLLESIGFHSIEKIDIYPPEYNRWGNTHF